MARTAKSETTVVMTPIVSRRLLTPGMVSLLRNSAACAIRLSILNVTELVSSQIAYRVQSPTRVISSPPLYEIPLPFLEVFHSLNL